MPKPAPMAVLSTPPAAFTRPSWRHQDDAERAAVQELLEQARVTIVMACGTGKTRTSARISGRVAALPDGGPVTMVVMPTLLLLEQTVREWSGPGRRGGVVIAVCSNDEAVVDVQRLGEPDGVLEAMVLRDPGAIAEAVRWGKGHGPVTVFVTYQSLPKIIFAHDEFGLEAWDLIVCDEAHRVTGATRSRKTKAWMKVHDDDYIPARRRLYMTATPKILDRTSSIDDRHLKTMSNTKLFGRIAFRIDMAEAVDRGLLAPFHVALSVVTKTELRTTLGKNPKVWANRLEDDGAGLRMVASQISLARAIRELGLKRVIVYFNSVDAARSFADSFKKTVEALPARARPKRMPWIGSVSGRETTPVRKEVMAEFTDPTRKECAIICNARVLTEGVDIPDVDAAMFADARSSIVDITQAVGRTARKPADNPHKKAWVLIPVYAAPSQGTAGEEVGEELWEEGLESSSYRRVARTLDALASHGGRIPLLPRDFTLAVTDRLPPDPKEVDEDEEVENSERWMRIIGCAQERSRELHRAVRLQTLFPRARDWQRWLAAADRFNAAFGHLDVPPAYLGDRRSGTTLRGWLDYMRQRRREDTLEPERIAELDALGMIWDSNDVAWNLFYAHAEAVHARLGHLFIDPGTTDGDYPIADRLAHRRQKADRLKPAQTEALDRLDPLWRFPIPWQRGARCLQTYVANGHTLEELTARTVHPVPDGFHVGSWYGKQVRAWDSLAQGQRDFILHLHHQATTAPTGPAPRG